MINVIEGDCRNVLSTLPPKSFHTCITSPPYFGLRDYGSDEQIGMETTPPEFVGEMVNVFREVHRALRDDGTLWLNLGDSYAGGGNGGGGSFAKDGIRAALPGSDKNKAHRYGKRGAVGGLKPKDLIGIPWRVALALQEDGWYLRQDIIWSKPNPMPESVKDRCTKSHEYLFMLTKSARYYYDAEAIRERAIAANIGEMDGGAQRNKDGGKANKGRNFRKSDKQRGHGRRHAGFNDRWDDMTKEEQQSMGRNKRSVWEIATQPFSGAHFATFPPKLIEPCILAGCPVGGRVLDPFGGAGTTGLVADRLQRNGTLIELNPEYADMARQRIMGDGGMFCEVV